MKLLLNGRDREFSELDQDPRLTHLLDLLQLKSDRVAVEHNGAIVARSTWSATILNAEDRLEIVQFVGGGK
ncbi:MAG TPA: sulfur carrier protein ThiS [Acidobacteriaceae bacterium]|jgi:thiamine biosynthesis protein ThiS|nr:sulfur carrier protein ThiS [Acidobacteriaceae bacterium]